MTLLKPSLERGDDVSIFSNIGRAVKKGFGDLGREVGRAATKTAPVASLLPGGGAITGLLGGASKILTTLAPSARPETRSQLPAMPAFTATHALLPAVAGPISTAIGGALGGIAGQVLPQFFPGLAPGTSVATRGCGCNGTSGRDPCTRQRLSSQPAPLATFFGGCCPPGRTLRRIRNGRDICIKTPKVNPFNPRALARADARITTFARRAAPIFKDLGYAVSSSRKVKLKVGRKRGRR